MGVCFRMDVRGIPPPRARIVGRASARLFSRGGLKLALLASRLVGIALAVGLLPVLSRAEVVPASLFSDGAVLQCEKPIAVWGTAKPGEVVQVTFMGEAQRALAGPDGRWITILPERPANSTGTDLTIAGKDNTVVIHDVLIGEVWLCSGQSNMEFKVNGALDAKQEIAAANFPLIRHVRINHQIAPQPADRVTTSGWKPATPESVGEFTAVGYFFARDIHQRLGVPVGLIHSSWGGTPVESWMSPMAVASDPAFHVISERWKEKVAAYPAAKAEYDVKFPTWTAAQPEARARGEKAYLEWLKQNPRPRLPGGGPNDSWEPMGLYNGMINPLVPYALRGVLWYQGESNVGQAAEYRALFSSMITAWRAHFGQGDIPFFWVNLANYRAPYDSSDLTWAFLREAQTQTLALPNTGQALAIDIGEADDIHPRNKQEVGRRLALVAKRRVYGLMADDTGPTFASAVREGAAIRVRFSQASGGLVAHNKPPQSLEIAGVDRVFKPALGKVERDTLVVWSPQVKEPVAVRYAWRNNPEANLYGGGGLPVVPFRSDEW